MAGVILKKNILQAYLFQKRLMHTTTAEKFHARSMSRKRPEKMISCVHTHPQEKKNFSCMKWLKKIMPLQLPNLPHAPTPQKSNGPSSSAISFGWFADFGKTLTINQRPSKLVYSDIREENYMFFFRIVLSGRSQVARCSGYHVDLIALSLLSSCV